ncbi:MAG: hypothetical protein V1685_07030 [Parcubacteria group bacterium]
MATEPKHDPNFRTIDMSAEAKKAWGPAWNEPEISYVFGDGDRERKFKLRTGDSAIYVTSKDFG